MIQVLSAALGQNEDIQPISVNSASQESWRCSMGFVGMCFVCFYLHCFFIRLQIPRWLSKNFDRKAQSDTKRTSTALAMHAELRCCHTKYTSTYVVYRSIASGKKANWNILKHRRSSFCPSGAKTLGPGKEFLLSGREVRTHGLRREKADVVHQTKRGL